MLTLSKTSFGIAALFLGAATGITTSCAQTNLEFEVSDPVRIGAGYSFQSAQCGITDNPDAETDVRIAVNPTDPDNIVVAMMRDYTPTISTGVTIDGGVTWRDVEPSLMSSCSMKKYGEFGDQDIDAAPDGTMFLGLTRTDFLPDDFNFATGNFALDGEVAVGVSHDGGLSWTDPVVVSPRGEYQHMILLTAHSENPGWATVIWHVNANPVPLEGNVGHLDDGFVYASTTKDNGVTWSSPIKVLDASAAIDLIEHTDGTLIAELTTAPPEGIPGAWGSAALVRSKDGGFTWEEPIILPQQSNAVFVVHPDGEAIMGYDGQTLVAQNDGSLMRIISTYDMQNYSGHVGVARSRDNGETWSDPVTVSEFSGAVANAALGRTGRGDLVAMWYDTADDVDGDEIITINARVAVSADNGQTWKQATLSEGMDLRRAPIWQPGLPRYLGNYLEIKPAGPNKAVLAYPVFAPTEVTGDADLHFSTITIAE